MTSHLISAAGQCETVALGLRTYQPEVPQCAIEISALITQINGISNSLRIIDNNITSAPPHSIVQGVDRDIEITLRSLKKNLDLVKDLFKEERRLSRRGHPPFAKLWHDFDRHMRLTEGGSLFDCLLWYCDLVHDLNNTLNGCCNITCLFTSYLMPRSIPLRHRRITDVRHRLEGLLPPTLQIATTGDVPFNLWGKSVCII